MYSTYPSNERFDFSEKNKEEELHSWEFLLKYLSDYYLQPLHMLFKEKCYYKKCKRKTEEIGLNKEEFVNVINEVIGNNLYECKSEQLFEAIDRDGNSNVTWEEFLIYAGKYGEPVFSPTLKIYSTPQTRRETIIKIILLETNKYFSYAIVSKYGRVELYDGNMNFLISYHSIMTIDDTFKTEEERRRRNRWITDAVYFSDVSMFALTNSTRSLIIYDVSGLKHIPLWLILSIPNIINGLAYVGKAKNKCILFLGDELGNIQSLEFVQPKFGILRKKHSDKLNIFYWSELLHEKEYVIFRDHGKAHNRCIEMLEYISENDTIISCSRDPEASVTIRPTELKRVPYVFKMAYGTSCFSYSKKLSSLITGSDNGIIRVWNYMMPSKPLSILNGHHMAIVDISILETQKLFLSCSRDGVFICWGMLEYKCIQIIKIPYPPFKILGRAIEWGKRCIFPGPPRRITTSLENNDDKYSLNTNLEVNKSSKEKEVNTTQTECFWNRSHILVTCCNFIAQLNATYYRLRTTSKFEAPILPPPPLRNSVLIPDTWNISTKEPRIDEEKIKIDLSTEKAIKNLSFILDTNLLDDENKTNINLQISALEKQKFKMNSVVAECAPFLALNLPQIEEITIHQDLSVPNTRSIKCLIEQTNQMLSSYVPKTMAFSESSKSRSSRSSLLQLDV